MGNATSATHARDNRPMGGRRSGYCHSQAVKSLLDGGGLHGPALDLWYARLETMQRERGHAKPVPKHIAEFRTLLNLYSYKRD